MARERQPRMGCGAIAFVMLLVVVAVVLAGTWSMGLLDRVAYLVQVENQREQMAQQAAQEAPGQADRYVYSQLNDEDRQKYLVLLDAFRSREARSYPETTLEDLTRIRDCVLADNPDLFYINGVQLQTVTNQGSGLVTDVSVEGQYAYSAEEAAALDQQVQEAAATCLADLSGQGATDDYAKAKYFYEFLAATVDYDHEAAEGAEDAAGSSGQTVADALVGHTALCAGYARAYQYLLQQAGIPCVFVTGTARDGGHAWCAVFLDDHWYQVDPTWGDPQFLSDEGVSADSGRINYDYLCVTDADMASTHAADGIFPLPACTSMQDNYYVREGLYLTEPDMRVAGVIIEDAVAREDTAARFRCSDRDVYDQLVYALFDDSGVYRFLPGDTCRYLLNDDLCTVEVIL